MPTWGVWVGEAFYWEGGLQTRRARNVALRRDVVVSVGGDEAAVIIEGHVVRVTDPDPVLEAELVAAFAKYTGPFDYTVDPDNWRTGGLWRVDPHGRLRLDIARLPGRRDALAVRVSDERRPPLDPERPWNDWLRPTWDDAPAEPSRAAPTPGPAAAGPAPALGPRIRSVAEVTREIKDRLRAVPALRDLWVEGEVGQVSMSAAGHCYFTLKDDRAQLRAVIFRDERRAIPFEPRTGLRIVAHGRVDVFEQQGHYQLYVDMLQPAGLGDLALRLEAIKARLAAEGLFEAARKRPLPAWPRLIGVATSAQGAVLHDITRVLERRWPLAGVVLSACLVQGDAAPISIVAALRRLAAWRDPVTGLRPEVVILARGGGSLEDLVAVQRRAGRARGRQAPRTDHLRCRPRDGRDADRLRGRPARRDAVGGGRAGRASPHDQAVALRALRARLDAGTQRSLRHAHDAVTAEGRALEHLHPAAVLAGERERVGLLLDRARVAMDARLARLGPCSAGQGSVCRWRPVVGSFGRPRVCMPRVPA